MENKKQAVLLREQGLTYGEIVVQTGLSLDWCKKNLKVVSKNKPEKSAIKGAILEAQSMDGITNGKIKYLSRSVYPFEEGKEYEIMEKKTILRFKACINKSENTVIRPYWMQPENAKLSFQMVLASVDIITQRMNEEVNNIRKTLDLDDSYDKSLRFAIIKMLNGSTLAHEGLSNHCAHLEAVADKLDLRNP